MRDIDALLTEIDEDEGLEPAATAADIDVLTPRFREVFGIDLPETIRNIWLRSDGVWVNGVHLYGTRDFEEGEQGRSVDTLGILESNERLLEGGHTIDSPLRFIGDVDDQLLAYDTSDNRWKLVDRTDWEPDDEEEDSHATCEELIRDVLESRV
ncbi:hypothetical protein [Propioniferax innocua]|uniref:SUKH superfamily protein n=1 Tax=Propioniferax innocua TaxID=1753 RepID=A0A542ZS83_9ACTN|nr:hypothetical protein [Propioniferax innocua]TQL63213.1 hypothetical protein FB460_1014 [Propioniferax innocua]